MIRKCILSMVVICLSIATMYANTIIKINGEEIKQAPVRIEPAGIYLKTVFTDGSSVLARMDSMTVVFNGHSAIFGTEYYTINKVVNGTLSIEGLSKGDVVSIYSADGKLFKQTKAVNQELTIDISGYPEGIYVAKIGKKAVKFLNTRK